MNNVLLECEELSFYYEHEKIFGPIDLKINSGEILSIIGPNGGGKSTFLKLITKLYLQSGHYHGSLKISGQERRFLPQSHFPIGYLPQKEKLNLLIPIKAKEILEAYKIQNCFFKDQTKQYTKFKKSELLDRLGLNLIIEKDFRGMSGGQRQRVMLAKALLINTPLIILDEPAKGLDIQGQKILKDIIIEIRRKNIENPELAQTIIIVDHDIPRAIKLSDKILCLNREAHWHDSNKLLTQNIINNIYQCEIDHMIPQGANDDS